MAMFLFKMKVHEIDSDGVRRIKKDWNRFVTLFWSFAASLLVIFVLVMGKWKSSSDDSWGYLIWLIMLAILPATFGPISPSPILL